MTAYYNEFEPFAVEWLTNLNELGAIAPGIIDPRSIEELTPFELTYYTQVHLFAGIGVWSYALRQAGWRDDRPVWTCSCPCQPFSASGNGDGFDDPRHLWPHAKRLVKERRPLVIFGEQVSASRADPWFDLVQTDLENMGYAFGLCPFPAAGVGAPHKRDRAYWCAILMGDANGQRLERHVGNDGAPVWTAAGGPATAPGISDPLADTDARYGGPGQAVRTGRIAAVDGGGSDVLADADVQRQSPGAGNGICSSGNGQQSGHHAVGSGDADPLAYPDGERHKGGRGKRQRGWPQHTDGGPVNGFWRNAIWIPCRDDVYRPVESRAMPLAYGFTRDMGLSKPQLARMASRNRNGRIKGYGNAIVAPAAIEFIKAVMAALEDRTWMS